VAVNYSAPAQRQGRQQGCALQIRFRYETQQLKQLHALHDGLMAPSDDGSSLSLTSGASEALETHQTTASSRRNGNEGPRINSGAPRVVSG
jgi:hypothetical protein